MLAVDPVVERELAIAIRMQS